MKKRIFTLCIVLILALLFVRVRTNAVSSGDETGKAFYTSTSQNLKTIISGAGCLYEDDYGTCENKTVHVSLLTQNCDVDKYGTKLVTWAIPSSDGSNFTRDTVANICKDYEKRHPGWIVLGGSNSDQYTLGFGTELVTKGRHPFSVQPYYPLICDNEKWFSNTWFAAGAGSNGNFVGITNTGEIDPLNWVEASKEYAKTQFTCQVLDEDDKVIATFPVDSLNGNGETVVYTGYYSDVDLGTFMPYEAVASNMFVVGQADMAYCNNNSNYTHVDYAQDAFYGKGTITEKSFDYTLGKGQFAISTKNAELLALLKVGVKIRCQYEYVDQTINSYESCVGFHTIQRFGDVDQPVSGSYNTNSRPRSVIGRQANGTLCLLVIDDYNNSYGVSGYGINAICKAYGIVEAYQMDGGGSAQMAIRDENSNFKGVTYSDDYTFVAGDTSKQRKVFTALLFVMRDPASVEPDKVEYVLNGGTVDVELETTYTSYKDLSLPVPVKEGCVFDAWYLDENFENKVSRKVSGDIILYAKFYRLGDMNDDDVVDLLDCILMRIYYVSGEYDEYYEWVFDMNQNDMKEEADITLAQEKVIE